MSGEPTLAQNTATEPILHSHAPPDWKSGYPRTRLRQTSFEALAESSFSARQRISTVCAYDTVMMIPASQVQCFQDGDISWGDFKSHVMSMLRGRKGSLERCSIAIADPNNSKDSLLDMPIVDNEMSIDSGTQSPRNRKRLLRTEQPRTQTDPKISAAPPKISLKRTRSTDEQLFQQDIQ
eukprot:148211-Amphidinium_carterae.1